MTHDEFCIYLFIHFFVYSFLKIKSILFFENVGALQVTLLKCFHEEDSAHSPSGIYIKCKYALWDGKNKKKSSLRIPVLSGSSELKSLVVKSTKVSNQPHSASEIDFKSFNFTLCPSHGGLEWAEYVCLEIHNGDVVTDHVFGVVYIPIGDFDLIEQERTYPVSKGKSLKHHIARLTIRLKRIWSVPKHSSAASVGGSSVSNLVFTAGSTDSLIDQDIELDAESRAACKDHGSVSDDLNVGSVSTAADSALLYPSSDNSVVRTDEIDTGITGANSLPDVSHPKKGKGIVKNVGSGIYHGVAGGIGIAGGIGMGIAGGIGVAGGVAGGIGMGIAGGIAGGIVGGLGIAGDITMGIAGGLGVVGKKFPEPVGVVTLRCLLKESSEYLSMWPGECLLAGALRENSSSSGIEKFCVAAGYDGLVLKEVSENELIFNRRLKPITFVTDIFDFGSKDFFTSISDGIDLKNEKNNDLTTTTGEKTKRVSFITPFKKQTKEEKKTKKEEKIKSLALLLKNENAKIKRSNILSEYIADREKSEKIIKLKKEKSKPTLPPAPVVVKIEERNTTDEDNFDNLAVEDDIPDDVSDLETDLEISE